MDNQTLILCVGSAVFAFCLIAIVIVLSKKKKQNRMRDGQQWNVTRVVNRNQ